ncbi:MAG TPA: dephospho-CoA kinase [Nitrospiria bacterium]|jgi:dephospho-CoA kinase
MILAGLTGGIASGKSVVSGLFRDRGAYIIDADRIAHEVISPSSPPWGKIVEAFGKEILLPDKSIDRKKLGRIVFDDPEKREELNAIVHPRVFAEEERQRKAIVDRDPQAVIIFDVPLLIETRSFELMDKVILVYVNRALQLKRLVERDNLTRDEAKKRVDSQIPLKEKRQYADYIIDGGEPIDQIRERVEEIFLELSGLA